MSNTSPRPGKTTEHGAVQSIERRSEDLATQVARGGRDSGLMQKLAREVKQQAEEISEFYLEKSIKHSR